MTKSKVKRRKPETLSISSSVLDLKIAKSQRQATSYYQQSNTMNTYIVINEINLSQTSKKKKMKKNRLKFLIRNKLLFLLIILICKGKLFLFLAPQN